MKTTNFVDEMNIVKADFLWETATKEKLRLEHMSTKHVFNAMKMLYNHVAEVADLPNLPAIWYHHRYSKFYYKAQKAPRWMLQHIVIFVYEIEVRGDLPGKYRKPYNLIISAILEALKINNNPGMIGEMWKLLPERAGE